MKEVKKGSKKTTSKKTTKNVQPEETVINSKTIVGIGVVVVLTIGILFGFNLLNKDDDVDVDHVDIGTTTTTTLPQPTEIITEPSTTVSTTKGSDPSGESYDANTLAYYYKHYLMDNELYDADTMKTWVVKEVKYLGYYKNDVNTKYFSIKAKFECIDGSQKCIYIEQALEEDSTYIGAFSAKKKNSKYTIVSALTTTFESLVKNDPDIAKDFVLVDKVLK